ncbi:MAG: tetratricopeptide repeat protein [Clostridiales bacterium]
MAKKFKNPYEKSNIQSIRSFTDRTNYIKAFWDNIEEQSDEDVKILTFYGVGGIGKTSLINELRRQLNEIKDLVIIHIDLDSINNAKNKENILIHIMDQLKVSYKIKFPIFDYALMTHLKMSNPMIKHNTDEMPYIEESEFLSEVLGTLGDIPIVGLIPSILKLGLRGKQIIDKWSLNSKKDIIDDINGSSVIELQKKLPKYLACDIYDYLIKKNLRAVVFIDTYELALEENRLKAVGYLGEEWLNGDDGLIVNLPKTFWVIGSREKLRWDDYDSDWKESLEQYLIGNLDKLDTIRFLNTCEINDDKLCSQIYIKTSGHPFYLDLLVDMVKKGENADIINRSIHTPVELIERFLRYLYISEKELLSVLANANMWNRKLYAHICKEYLSSNINITFDNLIKYSFVKKDDERNYELHLIMKQCLLSEQSEDEVISINKFLFDYYSTKEINFNFAFKCGLQVSKITGEIDVLINWFIKNISKQMFDLNVKDIYELAEYLAVMNKVNPTTNSKIIDQVRQVENIYIVLNIGMSFYFIANYKAANMCINVYNEKFVNDEQKLKVVSDILELKALIKNKLGDYNESIEFIKKALENRILNEKDSIEHARTLNNFAAILDSNGELLVALEKHLEAKEIFESNENMEMIQTKEHSEYINNLFNICELYTNIGKVEEAMTINHELLILGENKYGSGSLEYAKYVNNMGTLYMVKKEYGEARHYISIGLNIRESKVGKEHLLYSNSLRTLAKLEAYEGNSDLAIELFKMAIEIRKRHLGDFHPYTINIIALYLNILIDLEKLDDVEDLLLECIRNNDENSNITKTNPIQFHLYVSAAKYYNKIGNQNIFTEYNNYLKIIIENISSLNYSFDYENVLKYIYP